MKGLLLDAQFVVDRIGDGVRNALSTNQRFLGVEVFEFENADIHPEYITTVEVGKCFTNPEWAVGLETHMKVLRRTAFAMAKLKGRTPSDETVGAYRFGEKDSQRLDIVVRRSDGLQLPLLIAEAKLGVSNARGVLNDIWRIVRLLTMYVDFGFSPESLPYGAVLFHSMDEGNASGSTGKKAQALLDAVEANLLKIQQSKSWLRSKAGLINKSIIVEPASSSIEVGEDGFEEQVFAKPCFTFAPGLILLGAASDIGSVQI